MQNAKMASKALFKSYEPMMTPPAFECFENISARDAKCTVPGCPGGFADLSCRFCRVCGVPRQTVFYFL